MEHGTQFNQVVRCSGKSLEITIPARIGQFEGISDGDWVLVTVKKIEKK